MGSARRTCPHQKDSSRFDQVEAQGGRQRMHHAAFRAGGGDFAIFYHSGPCSSTSSLHTLLSSESSSGTSSSRPAYRPAAAAAAARRGGICTLVPKWVLSALAERFWDVGSGAQGLLRALRRRVGLVRVCQVGSRTGANTVSAPRPRYLAIVEGCGLRTFPTSAQTRTTTVTGYKYGFR